MVGKEKKKRDLKNKPREERKEEPFQKRKMIKKSKSLSNSGKYWTIGKFWSSNILNIYNEIKEFWQKSVPAVAARRKENV